MRKKLVSILLLFLILLPTTGSSALLSTNGDTWNRFSKSDKDAYLYGLFDGMTMARQLIAMRLEDPLCRDSADFAFILSFHKFIAPISNETILKELDQFYKVKQNQSVKVSDAFIMIIHKLYGIPDNISTEMLENAQNSMEASEASRKSGETQLPIEKR